MDVPAPIKHRHAIENMAHGHNLARGFLPTQDPITQLPAYYTAWEQLAGELPILLTVKKASWAIQRLPKLCVEQLESPAQVERAMLLLSMFASAYVWGQDIPQTCLPQVIAEPLWQVADSLDRPPILSYTSIVFHNWRRLNKDNGSFDLDNLALQHSFWGGVDEQWFYLISIAIEAAGAPALSALVAAQHAITRQDVVQLTAALQTVGTTIATLNDVFARVVERCDPYIFYHRIRHFIRGWPDGGVIYENVSQTPQRFVGSSAAQSPLIQAIDAGLAIKHTDEKSAYLHTMRAYMQREHRHFIEHLEMGPSVREFVMVKGLQHPTLSKTYNTCVGGLEQFRKQHLTIAVRYIAQQSPDAKLGTGGTSFVQFLNHIRKGTKGHLIKKESLSI